MPLLIESEYATYGFLTGTATAAQVEIAISITEDTIESYLNTSLSTGTATERFTWPGYQLWRRGPRPVQLSKNRIITVDLVTTIHEDDKCDCETTSYTGCSYVKEADSGIIEVYDDCWTVDCGCCSCCDFMGQEAFMVDITYTYGFTVASLAANTSDGRTVRLWIAVWAQEVLNLLLGLPSALTAAGVIQWASMNYSERIGLLMQTAFGDSPLAQSVARGLRRLKIKRAVKFGGRR